MADYLFCWLYKSGGPYATHKADEKGRPNCGARVDTTCLMVGPHDPGPPYCKRCFDLYERQRTT